MQANLMNVVLLCKNGTPHLAAKLVNTNTTVVATGIVARMPEMLSVGEFNDFKKYLIAEEKATVGEEYEILTAEQALELAEYANRRTGRLPEEQPAPIPH